MSNTNISEKWADIIKDMNGDDVVLEIKVINADLDKQNALLKFLHTRKNNVNFFYAGQEVNLPSTVTSESFAKSESRKIIIDLITCKLHYYFNAVDEIEFYTDSVVHLNYKEASPIFEFIQQLGNLIQSKIELCIESYPKSSYQFDPLQRSTDTIID